MMGHSPLGASGIHRVVAGCFGSVAMQAQFENTSSPAARTGTAAHELGEKCLKDPLISPWDFKGSTIEVEGEDVKVDALMCEGVDTYLAVVNSYADFGELWVEVEFHLRELHEQMWGTADAVVVIKNPSGYVIHVFDFKNGFNPVEVEGNSQLLYYAIGAVSEVLKRDLDALIEEIHLHVVQPNALHKDGPHRTWQTDSHDLTVWRDEVLMPSIRKTEEPGAQLKAGEWCMFCRAEGACPALDQKVTDNLKHEFSLIQAEPDAAVVADMLPTSRLEEICLAGSMIKNFIDKSFTKLQERLENGEDSEHFMLVNKKTNRKWIDEDLVISTMSSTYDLFEAPKLKSPAQLESTVAQAMKLKGTKHHRKSAKEFLEHLWDKPDAGVVIAPRTSARIEQGPSVVTDFMDDDPMFR